MDLYNSSGEVGKKRQSREQNDFRQNDNSTLSKTFKQLQLSKVKSTTTIQKVSSPLNELIQLKTIKNDEFLFRMKLKFIACMQQLQLSKEQIQTLRKQQSDSQILHSFLNPIKRQFSELKKYKDMCLKDDTNQSSRITSRNIESLQMISLQSQMEQVLQSQKRFKNRSLKLANENSQLSQKLKLKQSQVEELQNKLYETKLLVKQYEAVIENHKSSTKKSQKDFIKQKEKYNEQLNALQQLLIRQRQAKQIYYNKLQGMQLSHSQKECLVQKYEEELQGVRKQCMKWKNRAEWKENEGKQEIRSKEREIAKMQQEVEKCKDEMKKKEEQVIKVRKQLDKAVEGFNKKLEQIVQEWKAKLIQTVQDYEAMIEKYQSQIQALTRQVQSISKQTKRDNETYRIQIQRLSKLNRQLQQTSVISKQRQSKLQKYVEKSSQQKDQLKAQLQKLLRQNFLLNEAMTQEKQQIDQLMRQNLILSEKIQRKREQQDIVIKKSKQTQSQMISRQQFYSSKIKQLQQILNAQKSQSLNSRHQAQRFKALFASQQQTFTQLQQQNNSLSTKVQQLQTQKTRLNQSRKLTESELLKRISSVENNRIVEISRLKVENQQVRRKYEEEIREASRRLGEILEAKVVMEKKLAETQAQLESVKQTHQQQSTIEQYPLYSKISQQQHSVNNSLQFNTKDLPSQSRQNRLISNQSSSPGLSKVRRKYIRSNSIHDYMSQSANMLGYNFGNTLTFKALVSGSKGQIQKGNGSSNISQEHNN